MPARKVANTAAGAGRSAVSVTQLHPLLHGISCHTIILHFDMYVFVNQMQLHLLPAADRGHVRRHR